MRSAILSLLWTFLLCLTLGMAADAAASRSDREFAQAKSALIKLEKSQGRERTYRDRWEGVIKRLQNFSDTNPRHKNQAEALYLKARATAEMADVSRIVSDYAAAKDAYLRVAAAAPQSAFAAEGLWAAASLAEKKLSDPEEAYILHGRIVNEQAKSRYAVQARSELKRLVRYAPPNTPPSTSLPLVEKKDEKVSARGTLTGVRSWSNPGYTRVVIDLSQTTEYTSTLLPAESASGTPPRLYLDLLSTVPQGGLPASSVVNDGLLRQIRTGKPSPDTTRVVLDLLSFENYKIFVLPDPFRIVIDIAGNSVSATAPAAVTPPVLCPAPVIAPPSVPDPIAAVVNSAPPETEIKLPAATASQTPVLSSMKIVVDAGHGGKDPGAIGPSGRQEKDIVLALALLLADEIRKSLGWEVVLTRSDDTFIPLEERTAIANKVGADLFLSLHVNASPNASARGIETYYLNYSKNEKAAAVAARENGTSLREVSDLEQILFDLMAHSKIQESSRLASDIQSALISGVTRAFGDVKNLGVKQGPFYVLLGANMPSVLVEAAFLSNPVEESRLVTRQYQSEATRAIIDGLRAYAGNPKMVARQ